MKPHDILQDKLFQNFTIERNLAPKSIETYSMILLSYCRFHNMSPSELIDEADQEEEDRIRLKKRKILTRLTEYRNYLLHEGYLPNTLQGYITKIKTFYRHYMIELPYMNPVKLETKQIMYEDIPHKPQIKELLSSTSNLKYRAIIYFMASTGSARQEVANLTINDFIEATKKYHDNTNDVQNILDQLEPQKDIIPLWKMKRQKTGYKYYTCCTPEATQHIIKYLRSRPKHELTSENQLFKLSKYTITKVLNRLTKKMGYPIKDGVAYFHPHAFRKYHTDAVNDKELANMLQGRKPDTLTEAYFKQNPNRIREEYMKHIPDLTFEKSKVVTIESDEVKKLKKQNKNLEKQVLQDKERLNDLQNKIESIERKNKETYKLFKEFLESQS